MRIMAEMTTAQITEYLKEHHYGNEAEVEKIYKEIGL